MRFKTGDRIVYQGKPGVVVEATKVTPGMIDIRFDGNEYTRRAPVSQVAKANGYRAQARHNSIEPIQQFDFDVINNQPFSKELGEEYAHLIRSWGTTDEYLYMKSYLQNRPKQVARRILLSIQRIANNKSPVVQIIPLAHVAQESVLAAINAVTGLSLTPETYENLPSKFLIHCGVVPKIIERNDAARAIAIYCTRGLVGLQGFQRSSELRDTLDPLSRVHVPKLSRTAPLADSDSRASSQLVTPKIQEDRLKDPNRRARAERLQKLKEEKARGAASTAETYTPRDTTFKPVIQPLPETVVVEGSVDDIKAINKLRYVRTGDKDDTLSLHYFNEKSSQLGITTGALIARELSIEKALKLAVDTLKKLTGSHPHTASDLAAVAARGSDVDPRVSLTNQYNAQIAKIKEIKKSEVRERTIRKADAAKHVIKKIEDVPVGVFTRPDPPRLVTTISASERPEVCGNVIDGVAYYLTVDKKKTAVTTQLNWYTTNPKQQAGDRSLESLFCYAHNLEQYPHKKFETITLRLPNAGIGDLKLRVWNEICDRLLQGVFFDPDYVDAGKYVQRPANKYAANDPQLLNIATSLSQAHIELVEGFSEVLYGIEDKFGTNPNYLAAYLQMCYDLFNYGTFARGSINLVRGKEEGAYTQYDVVFIHPLYYRTLTNFFHGVVQGPLLEEASRKPVPKGALKVKKFLFADQDVRAYAQGVSPSKLIRTKGSYFGQKTARGEELEQFAKTVDKQFDWGVTFGLFDPSPYLKDIHGYELKPNVALQTIVTKVSYTERRILGSGNEGLTVINLRAENTRQKYLDLFKPFGALRIRLPIDYVSTSSEVIEELYQITRIYGAYSPHGIGKHVLNAYVGTGAVWHRPAEGKTTASGYQQRFTKFEPVTYNTVFSAGDTILIGNVHKASNPYFSWVRRTVLLNDASMPSTLKAERKKIREEWEAKYGSSLDSEGNFRRRPPHAARELEDKLNALSARHGYQTTTPCLSRAAERTNRYLTDIARNLNGVVYGYKQLAKNLNAQSYSRRGKTVPVVKQVQDALSGLNYQIRTLQFALNKVAIAQDVSALETIRVLDDTTPELMSFDEVNRNVVLHPSMMSLIGSDWAQSYVSPRNADNETANTYYSRLLQELTAGKGDFEPVDVVGHTIRNLLLFIQAKLNNQAFSPVVAHPLAVLYQYLRTNYSIAADPSWDPMTVGKTNQAPYNAVSMCFTSLGKVTLTEWDEFFDPSVELQLEALGFDITQLQEDLKHANMDPYKLLVKEAERSVLYTGPDQLRKLYQLLWVHIVMSQFPVIPNAELHAHNLLNYPVQGMRSWLAGYTLIPYLDQLVQVESQADNANELTIARFLVGTLWSTLFEAFATADVVARAAALRDVQAKLVALAVLHRMDGHQVDQFQEMSTEIRSYVTNTLGGARIGSGTRAETAIVYMTYNPVLFQITKTLWPTLQRKDKFEGILNHPRMLVSVEQMGRYGYLCHALQEAIAYLVQKQLSFDVSTLLHTLLFLKTGLILSGSDGENEVDESTPFARALSVRQENMLFKYQYPNATSSQISTFQLTKWATMVEAVQNIQKLFSKDRASSAEYLSAQSELTELDELVPPDKNDYLACMLSQITAASVGSPLDQQQTVDWYYGAIRELLFLTPISSTTTAIDIDLFKKVMSNTRTYIDRYVPAGLFIDRIGVSQKPNLLRHYSVVQVLRGELDYIPFSHGVRDIDKHAWIDVAEILGVPMDTVKGLTPSVIASLQQALYKFRLKSGVIRDTKGHKELTVIPTPSLQDAVLDRVTLLKLIDVASASSSLPQSVTSLMQQSFLDTEVQRESGSEQSVIPAESLIAQDLTSTRKRQRDYNIRLLDEMVQTLQDELARVQSRKA